MSASEIRYDDADEHMMARLHDDWGELVARHLHFSDGFTLLARHGERVIGLIAVYWLELPPPISGAFEDYIDLTKVRPAYRRQGVARQLVALALQRAQEQLSNRCRNAMLTDASPIAA